MWGSAKQIIMFTNKFNVFSNNWAQMLDFGETDLNKSETHFCKAM